MMDGWDHAYVRSSAQVYAIWHGKKDGGMPGVGEGEMPPTGMLCSIMLIFGPCRY